MSIGTLDIFLDRIQANWRALDALSGPDTETGATVKANAYSLGAFEVAQALRIAGARSFFVASAFEGPEVRRAVGPEARIFVYAGHMDGDTETLVEADLTPVLNSIEQVTYHIERLSGTPFAVQLDTGMNRLGMEPEEWFAARELLLRKEPVLVMSHMGCADAPGHPMNAQQLLQFQEMTDGLEVPLSLSATAGILLGEEYHFDLVRPGIGLHGGWPFEDGAPAIEVTVPVIQTRALAVGEAVGYGNSWIATRPTRLATIAAGYADGVIRAGSGALRAMAGDRLCPVVGRISMDLITVDVTDLPEQPAELRLIAPGRSIDDAASDMGTIGHEVLTSLGARYRRRYHGAA